MYKKIARWDWVMGGVAVGGIVLSLMAGNRNAAIWAFGCLLWVIIAHQRA